MKLHVGNLSKQVTDEEFNELALPFGKPDSSTIARELAGGSKGFGFIEYKLAEEAQSAITGLDGKDVRGQALKVSEANGPKTKLHLVAPDSGS